MRKSIFCRLGAGVALLACVGARAGQDLVPNGGFEAAAPEGPPPGWSMWGASRHKDPANFTRDTARPHGGQACFRIHHPARTAGYVVSSPDHAIRTEKMICRGTRAASSCLR